MAALSDEVKQAWANREGAVILTTINSSGIPNSIYATCVSLFDNKLVVADNYFDKTRANIKGGSKGSILFMTKEGKAYQAKGELEYHESGPVFDDMKKWNPKQHPGHAAAALKVDEVYSGADKLL
ncbi:MAG: pyridoxamine 5'-phosphate oxidase family protein [Planctomycetes bacterium]|nr:pyridoxamine 5'-phosphate oxidase family protein [Planctomycetota bacterium]